MSETTVPTGIEILVFEVAGQRLGVHSKDVREVLRAVTLSPLPNAPAAVEGVLNLRGHVVPVLDIRAMLHLSAKPIEHTDHLIVVQAGDRVVTIRADRAVDLVRLEAADVEATETVVAGVKYAGAIAKTAEGLVNIIEPQTFLSRAESASLATAVALEKTATAEVAV